MKSKYAKYVIYIIAVLFLTWLLIPVFSFADKVKPEAAISESHVKVSDVWARKSLKGQSVGAAYLTIENTGDKLVSLVAAEADIAGRVEIHTHIHNNGVMQMRKLDKLDVAPKSSQFFKPGGFHLMLFDMKKPLIVGEVFPIILKFADGKSQIVKAQVK